MNNYRKIFNEGLNADDDFSLLGKGQWINASNVRAFTTDKGATGRVEAVRGNALVFDTASLTSNSTTVTDHAIKTTQTYFYGTPVAGTVINIYLITGRLIGTYTVQSGDNIAAICTGLATSLSAILPTIGFGTAVAFSTYVEYSYYAVNTLGRVEIIIPSQKNKCIGAVADETRKRIIFAKWSSINDHAIFCYDKAANTTYTILKNGDVEGGILFDKYYRINSNMKIIGDILIFTDYKNEVRKLNIEAAIKTYQSGYTADYVYSLPIKYTDLTLIKRPPVYPLAIEKKTDSGFTGNYIDDKAYQFTYRYNYKDNEVSALAAYSRLAPYNYAGETYNSILVTMPLSEKIDDNVYSIELCVKYGNTGKTFIVKTFNKDANLSAINLHNAGTTAISFTFYDDTIGRALSDVESVASFDNIPLLTKTIEVAKNRLFLGNNKFGYNTPKTTSLSLTVGTYNSPGSGSYTSQWKYVDLTYRRNAYPYDTTTVRYYYAYNSSLSPYKCFYFSSEISSVPSSTLNSTSATYKAFTEEQLAYEYLSQITPPSGFRWEGSLLTFNSTGNTTSLIFTPDLNGLQFFKSGSTYKASIAFFDRHRRKCGIVDKDIQVTTPLRTFNQTVFAGNIQWALSNTSALSEIPDWAYYYQIHISKNRTTRNFFQIKVSGTDYVLKNQDGTYSYSHSSFSSTSTYATAFDLTVLTPLGLGYSFTDGDLIRVFKGDGTSVLLNVLGVDGNFLLATAKDLGPLNSSTGFLIEVFTPYKLSDNEGLYETGNVYNILNPATSLRTYQTIAGVINGDCYAIQRGTSSLYFAEAMSPNDKFWTDWQTDTGWLNIVDNIGQQLRKGAIVFSDTFIPGTKVNGLNKFQPLNIEELDDQNGAIQKLQLANKVQADGSVMLAICEEETVSCYIGEQELFDTQGSAFVARANAVIGTTKALNGSMGTRDPESVTEHNGLVWWWDARNGCGVQYSNNGLFPITKNKMVRAANQFSKQYSSLSAGTIEGYGSNPFIIGGFDPYHKEVLFSIPNTGAAPKGNLEDYSIVYPYDIYDGKGKTLMYKSEADVWIGSMSFEAEMFIKMDNDLYSFKNGALYIHNQNSIANFYGIQYTANLMYANNPGAIHTYYSIGLEGNKKPSFVHLRTEDPYVQSSDLYTGDFVSREGVITASLFRDRLSPNVTGDYDKKQIVGDRLFGKALLVMLEWEFINDPTALELRFSNVGSRVNTGSIINK